MRQQTIHAIEQYIKRQAARYTSSNDKDECIDILIHVNELTPLVEHLGLAKDY